MYKGQLYLIVCLVFAGCTGADGAPGVRATCTDSTGASYTTCRVFRGRLLLPSAKELPQDPKPWQIAAVSFAAGTGQLAPSTTDAALSTDGKAPSASPSTGSTTPKTADAEHPRLYFGPVFTRDAGAGLRDDTPFSIVVPCGQSVNLLLQVPRDSGAQSPGFFVAAMQFPTDDTGSRLSTLIPRQPDELCGEKANTWDLGQVVLQLKTKGVLSSGSITLGQGNSRNPLELLDTDGDGTPDLADLDDDDDGVEDGTDRDAEGDGLVDTSETLGALPDTNKDGIPDLFQ